MMAILGGICCSPTLEWRKEREARGPGGTAAAGLVDRRWKVAGESGTTDEIRVPARKRHSTFGDRVLSNNHEILTSMYRSNYNR